MTSSVTKFSKMTNLVRQISYLSGTSSQVTGPETRTRLENSEMEEETPGNNLIKPFGSSVANGYQVLCKAIMKSDNLIVWLILS